MNTTYNFWANNRPNVRGSYDIFIRVTQARKHKLIKTGVTVSKRDNLRSNAKQDNWIKGGGLSTKKDNESLAVALRTLKDDAAFLNRQARNPSKERIINKYRGETSQDFMKFLDRIIKRFEKAGSHRTAKRYRSLLNKLAAFESDAIPFDSITVTFLKDFEGYMANLHQNTRYELFKCMKAAFNQAIQEDEIAGDQNPFLRFKFRQVPTSKEKLTMQEIKAIQKLKLPKDSTLNHTRNCFMFAFYCGGIRAGDIITMRWQNIQGGNLSYVMAKNRNSKLTKRNIPLLAEAKKILKQYQGKDSKPENFIFGELDNSHSKLINAEKGISIGHHKRIYNLIGSRNAILNKNLKKLAVMAKITKPLTFHIARHSFAQYAIDNDTPPKVLQAILGHGKFATTEIYLHGLQDNKVSDEMERLFK
jgi:site-specific recombinase XerD